MSPKSNAADLFLDSVLFRFRNVKELGEKAIAQISDEQLRWAPDPEANSIAIIIQHLHGNMISRWTDFLTTDGDKNRDRDGEFELKTEIDSDAIMGVWEEGWKTTLNTIEALQPDDLLGEVTIRGQSLGVIDAIERQLAHYAYHVGQMVYIARMLKGEAWQTLSIARGESAEYKPRARD